jgi:hypothetical protein
VPNHPGSENLRPIKPGEVRNPEGRNQYTARREAEKAWDELALSLKGDKRRLDLFLDKMWAEAEAGEPWAAKEVVARLLPVTTKIELPPSEPRSQKFIPTEDEQRKLAGKFRGNGHDPEPDVDVEAPELVQ